MLGANSGLLLYGDVSVMMVLYFLKMWPFSDLRVIVLAEKQLLVL